MTGSFSLYWHLESSHEMPSWLLFTLLLSLWLLLLLLLLFLSSSIHATESLIPGYENPTQGEMLIFDFICLKWKGPKYQFISFKLWWQNQDHCQWVGAPELALRLFIVPLQAGRICLPFFFSPRTLNWKLSSPKLFLSLFSFIFLFK